MMKKTVLRYGGYGTIVLVVLSALPFLFFSGGQDYDKMEVFGYLTMVLSMVFVFFGLRHYRDSVNGGVLGFGQGLKLGLLITLLPAIGFGLFDVIYTRVINPGWHAEYMAQYSAKLQPAERAAFEQQMALFSNPVFEFLLMAATVLIIGLIVTIISTLALMRKPRKELAV
ncbi:DUF4199 domain-containing protein [Flaviaesturariibacter flavus]|uniref:DUF4199 domain-containing protein n=1 Tax=Flaviaesturariibacter flavus TaxID=2502780 RepID=A0A4R1BB07_9BACT|nr:DUF4199 domain-containing protein [Flaviaesturariibacter flavus]TCJ14127.1 DUF4199 domain-containing protein [Flaviaesturariibacter flavus]